MALLLLGARMLRSEENAARRALALLAEGKAAALPAELETALAEDAAHFLDGAPDACPISAEFRGKKDTPQPTLPPETSETCVRAAEDLPRASPATREVIVKTLIAQCPSTRGAMGTLLLPGLLVEAQNDLALRAWLANAQDALTSRDRRALRTMVESSAFGESSRQALLGLLKPNGDGTQLRDRTLVSLAAATLHDAAPGANRTLHGETTIARSYARDATHAVSIAILDPEELVHCGPTRLKLAPELRLKLLDPSAQDSATTVRIAPELLVDVVPQGPWVLHARTRTTRITLGTLFGIAVLLGGAMLAISAARTRRAEDLAELRTDFAAAIAHELRTPLTSMLILTELLAEDSLSTEDRKVAATSLLEQTKRLSSSAERMLTLRSLMVQRTAPTRQTVDLPTILEEAISDFEVRAEGLAVERIFPSTALASSDPALLRVIVDNLMDNAHKYAGGPTAVSIADLDHQSWEISVRDDGPGVPDEMKDRLFDPFERADARLSETQGAGLGLAIVRFAADALGASVDVRDAEPRGTLFVVRVPKYLPVTGEPT